VTRTPSQRSSEHTPFIVVVSGGTASGKTSITARVAARTGALVIQHDRYYFDVLNPQGHNFDAPEALETDLLVKNLTDLRNGHSTHLPVYDFKTHSRTPHTERMEPGPLILVEGILTLTDERVRGLADLTVFVRAADDVRLARRLRRDLVERGRDAHSVLDQYLATVRPMHLAHVAPTESLSQLVLDGEAPIETSVEALLAALTPAQIA